MARKVTPQQAGGIIRNIQKSLDQFLEQAPKWLREQGKIELRYVREAYESELVFSDRGLPTPILPFGAAWEKIKLRNEWDMRKGHAKETGLSEGVGHPSTLLPTAKGYVIRLTAKRGPWRNYWQDFRDSKAPTLLYLKVGWQLRHRVYIRTQGAKLVKRIIGGIAKVEGNSGVIRVNMKLDIPLNGSVKISRGKLR